METLVRQPDITELAPRASDFELELEHARLLAETEITRAQERINSSFEVGQLTKDSIGSARRYVQNPTAENLAHVNKDAFFTNFEALSARTTNIPPVVRYQWSGDDFVGGGQTLTIMAANCLRGYDATSMEVSEFVLAVIPSLLYKQGDTDKVIRTFSHPKQFGVDTQLMIRDFWFEQGKNGTELVSKQLAYVGNNLTRQHLKSVERTIEGTQVINDEQMQTYLIDREDASTLEEVGASLDSSMGDTIVGGQSSSLNRDEYYEGLAAQTQEISKHAARLAPKIGAYSIQLAEQKMRPEFSNEKIKKEADRRAHELARHNPEIALFAFGEDVADLYRMADEAELNGDMEGANYIRAKAEEKETLVCEAGSCGLEAATDTETEFAHSVGLKGEILSLKERACPNPSCRRAGGILLDVKGNMACTHCKESNLSVKQKQASSSDDE